MSYREIMWEIGKISGDLLERVTNDPFEDHMTFANLFKNRKLTEAGFVQLGKIVYNHANDLFFTSTDTNRDYCWNSYRLWLAEPILEPEDHPDWGRNSRIAVGQMIFRCPSYPQDYEHALISRITGKEEPLETKHINKFCTIYKIK